MSSREQTIAGVVALIIIVVVYVVGLGRALQAKPTITSPEALPSLTVIEREIMPLLNTLELNGQLPVSVSPEELGKDNPFAP